MSNPARLTDDYDLRAFDHGSPAFSIEASHAPVSRLIVDTIDQCMNRVAVLETPEGTQPSEEAIATCAKWLPLIVDRACKIGCWEMPHITCSDQGEVVCEWWQNNRKITFYFGQGQPEFIKVWGTNIETEMDSGVLTDSWNLTSVWLWLHS
jgi:hypothetical protein